MCVCVCVFVCVCMCTGTSTRFSSVEYALHSSTPQPDSRYIPVGFFFYFQFESIQVKTLFVVFEYAVNSTAPQTLVHFFFKKKNF